MKDLAYYRPSYETRGGDAAAAAELEDAHRLVRTAAAIARAIDLPDAILDPALTAIVRVENSTDDERRLAPGEAAAIGEMIAAVDAGLNEAIDRDQRLRGDGAVRQAIEREAALPTELTSGGRDDDRVFELASDGRIAMLHPRMSLYNVLESLPAAARFLAEAAARGAEVALVE